MRTFPWPRRSARPRFPFRCCALLLACCACYPLGGLLATETTTIRRRHDAQPSIRWRTRPDDAPPPAQQPSRATTATSATAISSIKRFDGAGAGHAIDYRDSYEAQNSIELNRRVHLFDQIYLKLGAKYERFDFGATTAPLPTTLQSLHGIVGLEYVVKGEPAVYLYTDPGVFTSRFSHVNFGSVDVPVDIGTGVPVPFFHNVFGLVGMHLSALAHYPVYPILGVVWIINGRLSIQAVPPEPRMVYKVTDHLDVFAGGELLGEAYKTSYRRDLRPQEQRFNGAVIDYSETRVGGGLTYNVNKAVNFDFSGGCSLSRDFDYYRPDASKRFVTQPAPYAKIEFSAEF